jgi:hypothetical protein
MKNILALIFILSFSFSMKAQKDKEEKIVFYTDDVVKRSKVYAGLHYSPYFLTRNVVAAGTTPGAGINYLLNESTKGGYGQSYGLDLYYKFGSSLHFGLGVNASNGSYQIDIKEALINVGIISDSIDGDYITTTKVSYINVPIQFVYSIPFGDNWELEVIPAVEMNFLQSLNRSGTNEDDITEIDWGDIKEQGRDLNWTVSIGIGANYRITPKFTVFARPHFKYQLRPLLQTSGEYSDNPNEVLMWIGGQTGIRFYF